MTTFGRLEDFRLNDGEDWSQYTDRLGHYFEANEVTDASKKRAILLSAVGSETYKLICDLLAPTKPGQKSYEELVEVVKDHLQPKPSEIVCRFKFHTRSRLETESVSTFVAQLRHLSQDCNFGDTLEAMLRDRLVCGINNDRIQRRMLAEKDLDFKKALQIATAMEAAEKNALDLQMKGAERATANLQITQEAKIEKVEDWRKERFKPECWFCHAKGHVQKQCREYWAEKEKRKSRKPFKSSKSVKKVQDEENDSDTEMYTVFKSKTDKEKPYQVSLELDGVEIEMEVDTGASLTVISEDTLKQVKKRAYLPLQKGTRRLKTYTGQEIPVAGVCKFDVSYKGRPSETLEVVVVKGQGPNLLGRDWLKHIKLEWAEILHVHQDQTLNEILKEAEDVFDEKRGTINGVKAKIVLDTPETKPKYFKPRPVPYAIRNKVGLELDRMEAEGTIEKVQYSDWAAPIVTVVKPDGGIRICGDYKVTVNQASKLDNYPIPKTEDVLAELGGGQYFSKIDLTQAYTQLELEEDSKQYTTINTHQGLYKFNRLPYGISSAPGIYQRTMENLLRGISNVYVRIDDILIAGSSKEDHHQKLKEVLSRLKTAGAKLKLKKCVFMATELEYLGLKINREGIQPVDEKIKAIQEMPKPQNVKQLQSYLGMVNYYSKFLPNLSTILAPLYYIICSSR